MTPEEKALARAQSLVAIKRHQEALSALGPAFVSDATAFEAHCVAAGCQLSIGAPREAIAAASRALAIDAGGEWPHRLLAAGYRQLGLTKKAREHAEQAARLRPDCVPALHLLAVTQLSSGKLKAAAETASAAVAADPGDALAHETAGLVAMKRRDWVAAEHAYREALRIDPSDPDVALALGNLLKRLRRRPEASGAYLAAARTNPMNKHARRGLARVGLPRGGLELTLVLVAFAVVPSVLPSIRTPIEVAACAAVCIVAVLGGTTALRLSASRRLPDDVKRGLVAGHRRYALRWLAVAGAVALALGVWAVLAPEKAGGGPAEIVAYFAFGVGALLTWRRSAHPSLRAPASWAKRPAQRLARVRSEARLELPGEEWPNASAMAGRRPASLRARVHAGGIDALFVAFILVFAVVGSNLALRAVTGWDAKGPHKGAFTSAEFGSWLVATWLFFALGESRRGATPGKRARGLLVIADDGRRLTFLRASARFAGATVGIILAGVGLVTIPFSRKRQGLHELITRTEVVQRPGGR